ncbi:MAG: CvpA family protein [Pseudomonadota bacterium]
MTFLDWTFIAIIVVSMVVGAFRGFIKEAVSVGSLVIAVWAAFHFAPIGENVLAEWVGSPALRTWAARVAIFVLVLMLGGLAGWMISRFANQVGLSSTDRTLGLGFGFLRGAIISGLIVIVGPYLELNKDSWWQESKLLPYASSVANGISIIAPRAFDYLRDEIRGDPGDSADEPQPGAEETI